MMVLLIGIAHGILFIYVIFLCARKPKTKQYAEAMVNPNSLSSQKSVRGSDSKRSSSISMKKKKRMNFKRKHQKLETKSSRKEGMSMLLKNCETVLSKLNKDGRRDADAFATAVSEEATTSSPALPKEKHAKRKVAAAVVPQKPKIEKVRHRSRITDRGERDSVMGMPQVDVDLTQQSGYNAVQDDETDLRTLSFIKSEYGKDKKQPPMQTMPHQTHVPSQMFRPSAEHQAKIVASSDNEKESSGDVESGEKVMPLADRVISLTQAAVRQRPETQMRGGTHRTRRANENVWRVAPQEAKRRSRKHTRQR